MRRSALATVCVLAGSASAQLYGVNLVDRTLARVDPDTGVVTEVGPTGLPAAPSELEFVGARLFGVLRLGNPGSSLAEIDPATGQTLSIVPMTLSGEPLLNAVEGLGYDGSIGALRVAFWRPGATNTSASNTIGVLALDGTVTQPVSFGAMDFDGLGQGRTAGELYRVDREPGPNTVEVGLLSGLSPSTLRTFSFSATFNGVNAVSYAAERDELLALDGVTGRVHRLDPDTAELIGSVEYTDGYSFAVCAYRRPCPADLAPPFGVLDIDDVLAFLQAFAAGMPLADLAPPVGALDIDDVLTFLDAFAAGCP